MLVLYPLYILDSLSCIYLEDILQNMTALSESTSVKNLGVITERTFFHGHFLKELLRF